MLRTEMVDNLLDSYTKRELESLAKKLGVDSWSLSSDVVNDILFDPCSSYNEFNKLTEANNDK